MTDYAFVHDGRAFTPNQTDVPAEQVEAHNAAIEARELNRWQEQPAHQLAYYDETARTVTTWRGKVLGTITGWHVYRHNFGGRMVSLRVKGTNGAEYYGRASYDHGNCVQLRKVVSR